MREDIRGMPRVHRDAMNDGTWVDGEFHSDKKLASKGVSVTTTSDGIIHFRNKRLFISTPPDTPNYLWNTFVKEALYPDKYEETAIRYLGCRGKLGYKESFYDRWPKKNSKIGWLFYLGGKAWLQLLRRWLNNSLNSSRTLNLLSMDSDSQLYEEP